MKNITKLGVVCGSGDLPFLVVESAKKLNIPIVLAAIKGFADSKLTFKNDFFWSSLGEVGTIAEKFKSLGVTHICFAGAVKRPSIFSLKLDKVSKDLLIKHFKYISGDNSLLSLIVKTYEEQFGFKVISPQYLNNDILSSPDFYSKKQPSEDELEDIKLGFNVAKQIGSLDIGQSIIVQQKMVIAVEGVEGTHNLIKRSKKLLKPSGSKGILVKVKKPNQELRIDLPTIGLKTIKTVKKMGLAGIAVEEGATLILNKSEILEYANTKNLFVITINDNILKFR